MNMKYKSLIPSQRVLLDGGMLYPSKLDYHLIINWSKDLLDKTIKVLSIPNIPPIFDGFFVEHCPQQELCGAISSVQICTDSRTIKILC
jgi:hypothetical protein